MVSFLGGGFGVVLGAAFLMDGFLVGLGVVSCFGGASRRVVFLEGVLLGRVFLGVAFLGVFVCTGASLLMVLRRRDLAFFGRGFAGVVAMDSSE